VKPTGYSNKPLTAKLGFKAGETVMVFNPPDWLEAELQKKAVRAVKTLPATWVHGFFTRRVQLTAFLRSLDFNNIEKGLWVSWPKKTSNIPTDLSEHTFRDTILPLGWVDIKVAAIDDTWSGLKFTRRIKRQSKALD
jgi:hypothetical protein